jgi:hypothetical protein
MDDVTKEWDATTEEDNLVGVYTELTCHQKCQEDYECETFSVTAAGACKLYNYGACTHSVTAVIDTTLYSRSAFREIPLTIADRCTHFEFHNEDAPKVTACKEITDLKNCRLYGNYYELRHSDSVCGGVDYDMSFRKTVVDLSATAYTAVNCEAACSAQEPGDCQYFELTATTCTLYPGECTEDLTNAAAGD